MSQQPPLGYTWNGVAWVFDPNLAAQQQMQEAAKPPTMQPPPPPGYGAPPPQFTPPPAMMQPPYAPQDGQKQAAPQAWAAPTAPGGYQAAAPAETLASLYPQGVDFSIAAGAMSLPEGDHFARIDDVEYGESKAANAKATFKATVVEGGAAGRTGIWSYVINAKGIFRLGKEMTALNMPKRTNGSFWSPDPRTMCGEIAQELRGRIVKVRVTPQIDKDTKMPSADGYTNTVMLGFAEGAPTAQQPLPLQGYTAPPMPQAGQPAPAYQAAPPQPAPQVSYPSGPPSAAPANGAGFHTV